MCSAPGAPGALRFKPAGTADRVGHPARFEAGATSAPNGRSFMPGRGHQNDLEQPRDHDTPRRPAPPALSPPVTRTHRARAAARVTPIAAPSCAHDAPARRADTNADRSAPSRNARCRRTSTRSANATSAADTAPGPPPGRTPGRAGPPPAGRGRPPERRFFAIRPLYHDIYAAVSRRIHAPPGTPRPPSSARPEAPKWHGLSAPNARCPGSKALCIT